MKIDEFGSVLKTIKANYANFNVLDTKETIMIWFEFLKDIPEDDLKRAVVTYIATEKFPPTIADIRRLAINKEPKKDWSEAWSIVLKAISKFGYYHIDEAYEYIKSQDELAYVIAKRFNFSKICESQNLDIERANFRMSYENEQNIQETKTLYQNIEKLTSSKSSYKKELDGRINRLINNKEMY